MSYLENDYPDKVRETSVVVINLFGEMYNDDRSL